MLKFPGLPLTWPDWPSSQVFACIARVPGSVEGIMTMVSCRGLQREAQEREEAELVRLEQIRKEQEEEREVRRETFGVGKNEIVFV